jgi:hypothetical protein
VGEILFNSNTHIFSFEILKIEYGILCLDFFMFFFLCRRLETVILVLAVSMLLPSLPQGLLPQGHRPQGLLPQGQLLHQCIKESTKLIF